MLRAATTTAARAVPADLAKLVKKYRKKKEKLAYARLLQQILANRVGIISGGGIVGIMALAAGMWMVEKKEEKKKDTNTEKHIEILAKGLTQDVEQAKQIRSYFLNGTGGGNTVEKRMEQADREILQRKELYNNMGGMASGSQIEQAMHRQWEEQKKNDLIQAEKEHEATKQALLTKAQKLHPDFRVAFLKANGILNPEELLKAGTLE